MQPRTISENLSYREVTHSDTAVRAGIENTPSQEQLDNIILWAIHIFEPLRKGLGDRPVFISNMFRSKKLNELIPGSAKTSQHMEGKAADIDNDNNPQGPTNAEIFNYILEYLEFDQLIWEYGTVENPAWVHVSYNHGKNRRQVLRCSLVDGKRCYYPYVA
jgi:hypothetical protein